jgi:RimJ/RimL family protein N-acetyltransferase
VTAQCVRLIPLTEAAFAALVVGDLEAAAAAAGVPLSGYFVTDEELRGLWRQKAERRPPDERWTVHAALAEPADLTVGHGGFHGPPDESGMVEIGYSVDPAYRGRGYAKAIVRELLRMAEGMPEVSRVRASISPYNAASLGTIAGFGFHLVGERDDPARADARLLVFEAPA